MKLVHVHGMSKNTYIQQRREGGRRRDLDCDATSTRKGVSPVTTWVREMALRQGTGRERGSPLTLRASLLIVLAGGGLILLALYFYASTCLPGTPPPCPQGTPCPLPALYCVRAWTPLAITLLVAGAGSLVAGVAALASRPRAHGTRGSTGGSRSS